MTHEVEDFETLMALAEKNDSLCQLIVSFYFRFGIKVERNKKESEKWLEKSVAGGNELAKARSLMLKEKDEEAWKIVEELRLESRREKMMGNYILGICVRAKDGVKALEYFKTSAREGNPRANLMRGVLYHYGGEKVSKNLEKASKKYNKAAVYDAEAYYYLALLSKEKEMQEDYIKYYEMGALKNEENCLFGLGAYYEARKEYEKAIEKYELAHKEGHAVASERLGVIYEDALNNVEKAVEYYKLAGESGRSRALFFLANLFAEKGEKAKAVEYFEKAVHAGNSSAMLELGRRLVMGEDIEKDFLRAHHLFNEARKLGNKLAEENIRQLEILMLQEAEKKFVEHKNITSSNSQDPTKQFLREIYKLMDNLNELGEESEGGMLSGIVRYYKAMVENGNTDAMNDLANMYEKGVGLKQDMVKATELYLTAARKGNSYALRNLSKLKTVTTLETDERGDKYFVTTANGQEISREKCWQAVRIMMVGNEGVGKVKNKNKNKNLLF